MATYKEETTFLSSSTMYNLIKRPLTSKDFESNCSVNPDQIDFINSLIYDYKETENKEEKYRLFRKIKGNLPEGYLQKRVMFCTKKVLERIVLQRKNHYLREWHTITTEFERVLNKE